MPADHDPIRTATASSTTRAPTAVLPPPTVSRGEARTAPASRAPRGRADRDDVAVHAPVDTPERSVGHPPADVGDRDVTWQRRAELAEERIAGLERALVSRATIDQAKGMLAGVFGLDPDDAFEALVWVSQHSNVKLNTVAARFLDAVRRTDLGPDVREQITVLLADISRNTATSSTASTAQSTTHASPDSV